MVGDPRGAPASGAPDATKADTLRAPADPKMLELERLIAAGDWPGICRALGPPENAANLAPNLGLVYAVALYETTDGDLASLASKLGIRSLASIASVPPDSALALVLAKRMLRRHHWAAKPAPSAGFSIFFVVFALAFGSAIGWLLSSGLIRVHLPRW